jgi:mannose-6-phosphate isomerase-like protein (cupin superfamily)
MYKIISAETLELRPGGTVKFEGAPHGVDASFFHVKSGPGMGSLLHKHPYPETWLVRNGRVQFTVGDHQIKAGAGEIVIAAPNTPHKFLNVGDGLLEMFCVHTFPSIVQELVNE